jgi:hypothetical protein
MHTILAGFIIGVVLLLSVQTSLARPLAALISGLYGGDGITLATDPNANHAAHFTVDSSASINRFNDQIANQIGFFPVSSSASGFTFVFDPSLGTFLRTTETLGPLFAERAPTLGGGKLNLHFSYTFFTYDTFEGKSLSHFPVIARHEPDVIGFPDTREQFELDTVLIDLNIKLRVQNFTFAATYGITDRLDVSVFLPINSVDMDVRSHAQVVVSPGNTLFPNVHTFVGGPESPDDAAHGYAFGLGDVVLRAKYWLLKNDVIDISGAFLTQFATGNHQNFLGSGATTLRPFLVLSRTVFEGLTPHLNIGYEFNLNRGNQSALEYAVGFDAGTAIWTVAGDILGSYEPAGDGIGDNIITGSLGVKWNPWKQLVVLGNAQVPFNRNSGLRSDLILTFGVEYNF